MTTVIGTMTIFIIGAALSRKRGRRAGSSPPQTVFDL